MTSTLPPEPAKAPGPRFGLVALPVVAFAVIAVVFAFALQKGDPSKLPSALIGKPAPVVTVTAIEQLQANGRPVPTFTSDLIGKGEPAVLNFWASWCAPCLLEHPQLMDLGRMPGLKVHGINYKDQAAAARRFLALHGNPFVSVGADGNGRAGIEWGVTGMPETFIIDGRGVIVYKHVGPITPDVMLTKILPAIETARQRSGPPAKS